MTDVQENKTIGNLDCKGENQYKAKADLHIKRCTMGVI